MKAGKVLKSILIIDLLLCAVSFSQVKPNKKTISNKNASIEVLRKGDTTYFRVESKEKVMLSPECGEWSFTPDSIFHNQWGGADYPGYVGCYEDSSPLSSAYYEFSPISIREYIERLNYPVTIEPYNAKTLHIFRQESNDSLMINSKEEFLEFEKSFPRVKYFNSYGSGTEGTKISRFANGTHDFTVTFKIDCAFSRSTPNSGQERAPDYSQIWWAGKVAQKFRVTKTDSTYFITQIRE